MFPLFLLLETDSEIYYKDKYWPKSILSMFFPRIFVILGLIFKSSVSPFWIFFCAWLENVIQVGFFFFFCVNLSSSLNTLYWRGCLFPNVYFYLLCHRLSVDSFLGSLFCSIDLSIHFLFVCQDNAILITLVSFAVIQSLSHIWLFVTPWTATHQASLSFTISRTLV